MDPSPDGVAPWPATAPVAYWSFDVDARDASGEHDGVMRGTAAITIGNAGVQGEALALLAAGDRVECSNPTGFDFNRDFTWHAYIKTTSADGAIFSRNPAGTAWNQGSKALFVRANTVQWDTGWVSNPKSNVTVNDGAWHQVIAVYRATGDELDMFVDPSPGTTNGQYSGTHDVNRFDEHTHLHNAGLAETSLSMGEANFSGGLASLNTLIGLMDEVAVFDRALMGTELDQLIMLGPASFVPN